MHPDAPFGEVTKIVSEQWRSLSRDERRKYEEMARKDKDRYERELKDYLIAHPEVRFLFSLIDFFFSTPARHSSLAFVPSSLSCLPVWTQCVLCLSKG